jgi:hypothetical protein
VLLLLVLLLLVLLLLVVSAVCGVGWRVHQRAISWCTAGSVDGQKQQRGAHGQRGSCMPGCNCMARGST